MIRDVDVSVETVIDVLDNMLGTSREGVSLDEAIAICEGVLAEAQSRLDALYADIEVRDREEDDGS